MRFPMPLFQAWWNNAWKLVFSMGGLKYFSVLLFNALLVKVSVSFRFYRFVYIGFRCNTRLNGNS